MSNREAVFNKVRALLSKTVDNGCTEAEAMAALELASKLMQEHEITNDDLKLEDETAIIEGHACLRDSYAIAWKLCYAVGKFTETKAFGHKKFVKFAGLRSDVDFAIWLNQMLTAFVQAELKSFMWKNGYQSLPPTPKRKLINGFVIGATGRISKRLLQMVAERVFVTNSNALVIAKNALIDEIMPKIGKTDNRGRKAHAYSEGVEAGLSAGDKVGFGRPIEQGGMLRLK